MNRRYVVLSSANRNRIEFPNPYDFTVSFQSSNYIFDWVSADAPQVNWDMGDYFLDTNADFTTPYQWRQTGTVISPVGSVDKFIVTIDARKNGVDAPDVVDEQYTGLQFSQGGVSRLIISFVDNKDGTFTIILFSAMTIAAATFDIFSPPLDLNQAYIPNPISIISLNNAYTNFFLGEYEEKIISQITDFTSLDRVVTATTDFTLSGPSTFPDKFIITQSTRLIIYTITAVNPVAHTIEFLLADNPTISPSNLLNNYFYDFTSNISGQIIEADETAGTITITTRSNVDISTLAIGTLLGIDLFTTDNCKSFSYQPPMLETKWQDRGQVRIYDLELLFLTIPNKLLFGSPGGFPVNYPYFFVELENLSSESRTDQVIFSNNPNLGKACFVSPVMDISTPRFSSFTKLDGNGIIYPFNIKANDTLRLNIRSPQGQTLQLEESDSLPPVTPNPMLQVTAMFAITLRPPSMPCHSTVGSNICSSCNTTMLPRNPPNNSSNMTNSVNNWQPMPNWSR